MHRGPCAEHSELDRARARAARLASFEPLATPWGNGLHADRVVSLELRELALRALGTMPKEIETYLGLATTIPSVYLYANAEDVREGACVSSLAVAYYDGAIHAAATDQLELVKSLRHEFVHHALSSHDIHRPTWFQEGAAIVFTGSTPLKYSFSGDPLPVASMIDALPSSIDSNRASTFYLQAYSMMRFLRAIWKQGPEWHTLSLDEFVKPRYHPALRRTLPPEANTSEKNLVRALLDEEALPENLFEWAVQKRTRNLAMSADELLRHYLANGHELPPGVVLAE